MELVLTVVQAPPGTHSQDQQYVLTTAGGTIGRAETSACHLPCPDRVVSSQHASIQYQGGQFCLVDISKNGTEVNGNAAPKGDGAPLALSNGDVIQCGRFQLSVALSNGAMAALPKGLGNADFLSNAPALSPTPAFPAAATASDSFATPKDAFADSIAAPASDSLDDWLSSPSSNANTPAPTASTPPAAGMAGWGTVAEKSKGEVCPVEALGGDSFDEPERDIFGNPVNGSKEPKEDLSAPSPSAWEDDEWWKGESAISPSPASSAHIHVNPVSEAPPAPAIPTPTPSPAPSPTPRPSAAPTFAPAAPPATADAFASSHQNIDASNIDDVLGFDSAPAAPADSMQIEPAFPTETPSSAAVVRQAATDTSDSFGRHLGVNPKTQLPEQELKTLGAKIIRNTVSRLMELIKARTNIKNELRVQHTTLQAQDNNPLKFSVTSDDAVGVLFSESRSTSFMAPDEAIDDSFDDLSDHQIAVMAGMQAAYEHMFKQFSPTKLEALFNTKSGLLGNKRAANWEAFKSHYQRLTGDREATYNQLFGQTFAKHYEQRLAELKSQRMVRSPQSGGQ